MKKIVLVEDDELIANIYCNKLRVDGYDVVVALDGERALELITSAPPDLVILDLMVPKIPGIELLRRIRSHPGLQSLPVVVFSSTYLSSLIQEARQAGATKCLSKANCTPKLVLQVVQEMISAPSPAAASAALPSSPSLPEPAVSSEAGPLDDATVQAELRQSFIDSLPASLNNLRASVQLLIRATDEAARVKQLEALFHKIHALTGNAGIAGLLLISHVSDALEALLKELHEKPASITTSSVRTVALAVDFLGVLFDRSRLP